MGPEHQRQGLFTARQVTKLSPSEQVQEGDPEAKEAGGFRRHPESGGHASSQASAPKDPQQLASHQIKSEHSSSQSAWNPPHSPTLGNRLAQPSTQ